MCNNGWSSFGEFVADMHKHIPAMKLADNPDGGMVIPKRIGERLFQLQAEGVFQICGHCGAISKTKPHKPDCAWYVQVADEPIIVERGGGDA